MTFAAAAKPADAGASFGWDGKAGSRDYYG